MNLGSVLKNLLYVIFYVTGLTIVYLTLLWFSQQTINAQLKLPTSEFFRYVAEIPIDWMTVKSTMPAAVTGVLGIIEGARIAGANLRRSDADILKYIDDQVSSFYRFQSSIWRAIKKKNDYFSHNGKLNISQINDVNGLNLLKLYSEKYAKNTEQMFDTVSIMRYLTDGTVERARKKTRSEAIPYINEFIDYKSITQTFDLRGTRLFINQNIRSSNLIAKLPEILMVSGKSGNLGSLLNYSTLESLAKVNKNEHVITGWCIATTFLSKNRILKLKQPIIHGDASYSYLRGIWLNIGGAYLHDALSYTRVASKYPKQLRRLLDDKHIVAKRVLKRTKRFDITKVDSQTTDRMMKLKNDLTPLIVLELCDIDNNGDLTGIQHVEYVKSRHQKAISQLYGTVYASTRVSDFSTFDSNAEFRDNSAATVAVDQFESIGCKALTNANSNADNEEEEEKDDDNEEDDRSEQQKHSDSIFEQINREYL